MIGLGVYGLGVCLHPLQNAASECHKCHIVFCWFLAQCDMVMGSAIERGGPLSEAAGVHHDAKLGVHDLLLGLEEGVQHAIAGILLVDWRVVSALNGAGVGLDCGGKGLEVAALGGAGLRHGGGSLEAISLYKARAKIA